MTGRLLLWTYWGDYPLSAALLHIESLVRVGELRATVEGTSLVVRPPDPDAPPLCLPTGGRGVCHVGPVTYHLEHVGAPRRIPRLRPPERRLVFAALGVALLVTAWLSWTAVTVPWLGAGSPSAPAVRPALPLFWATAAPPPVEGWSHPRGEPYELGGWFLQEHDVGPPNPRPDCAREPIPPCPRGLRAFSVSEALRLVEREGDVRVVIDARYAHYGDIYGPPFLDAIDPAAPPDLVVFFLWPDIAGCGRYSPDGERVLAAGVLHDGELEAVLALEAICAVIPGEQPSSG